ncbi:unnamed protein product, partial [Porites lobata]
NPGIYYSQFCGRDPVPTCKPRVRQNVLVSKMVRNQSTYLFGKRFKNRLFVGGLPVDTTAQELAEYFSNFSVVIEAKVIFDEHQIPKGYGFVTFSSEEDVRNVTEMGTLFLRNKKLNLGPAVKKQVPTPVVENSELVVVSDNMRGEFFYPCPVSTVPVNPYQACHPVPHAYYAPSGYVNMQTAWKQPDLQIAPPFSVNVSSGHTHTLMKVFSMFLCKFT